MEAFNTNKLRSNGFYYNTNSDNFVRTTYDCDENFVVSGMKICTEYDITEDNMRYVLRKFVDTSIDHIVSVVHIVNLINYNKRSSVRHLGVL